MTTLIRLLGRLCFVVPVLLIDPAPATGQSIEMVVHMKDGTVLTFPVGAIRELTFSGVTGIMDPHELQHAADILSAIKIYPNPSQEGIRIEYRTSDSKPVHIRIYDRLGSLVRILSDPDNHPGLHSLYWNGKTPDGAALPAGLYLCTISTDSQLLTERLLLIR